MFSHIPLETFFKIKLFFFLPDPSFVSVFRPQMVYKYSEDNHFKTFYNLESYITLSMLNLKKTFMRHSNLPDYTIIWILLKQFYSQLPKHGRAELL